MYKKFNRLKKLKIKIIKNKWKKGRRKKKEKKKGKFHGSAKAQRRGRGL